MHVATELSATTGRTPQRCSHNPSNVTKRKVERKNFLGDISEKHAETSVPIQGGIKKVDYNCGRFE